MAITYIEVDTAQLNSDIRELEDNTHRASNSLTNLQSEIDELNTMWKGKARDLFSTQVKADVQIMREVLNEMSKLAECMSSASGEYVKCESEVKSIVDTIRV